MCISNQSNVFAKYMDNIFECCIYIYIFSLFGGKWSFFFLFSFSQNKMALFFSLFFSLAKKNDLNPIYTNKTNTHTQRQ